MAALEFGAVSKYAVLVLFNDGRELAGHTDRIRALGSLSKAQAELESLLTRLRTGGLRYAFRLCSVKKHDLSQVPAPCGTVGP